MPEAASVKMVSEGAVLVTREYCSAVFIRENSGHWLFYTKNNYFQKFTAQRYIGKKYREVVIGMRTTMYFYRRNFKSVY